MTDLTKEQMLAVNDSKIKKIYVKEWGGDIYIKQMSGKEQDELEKQMSESDKTKSFTNRRARYLALFITDKDGKRFFDINNKQEMDLLSEKSGKVLNYIAEEITKLNGVTEEELENIAKN